MLAFSWDHIGVMLGSFWHHAGINEFHSKCCGADFGSRIKISGNLLGQNDQNFDIYPFDWSQVTSRGLAAEGEALTIIECQTCNLNFEKCACHTPVDITAFCSTVALIPPYAAS